ncbi:MAG TPA: hypothetical protein PLX15_02035 [Candidatus Woesearchaeota archaeon]|nr:hypothetical protein [Candidatus Woesearchaeota archaeon]
MAIDKLVDEEIKKAEDFASLGSVEVMEKHLKCALEIVDGLKDYKSCKDLENKARAIEKEGYFIGLNRSIDKAKEYALKGNDLLMENELRMAKHCAHKVSIEITKEVGEIKRVGYSQALPERIKKARIDASKGDIHNMEKMIARILTYANYVGGDILENTLFHTEIIRIKGYFNNIDLSFCQALKALEKGNNYYAKECILRVKKQFEKLGFCEHMDYFNEKLREFKGYNCKAQKIVDTIF